LNKLHAKAVLFDLDGTLIESFHGILATFNHALAEMGAPEIAYADLRKYVGPPLEQSFAELVGTDRAKEGAAVYRERYLEVCVELSSPMPGATDVLGEMRHRGHGVSLVTNKKGSVARFMVEGMGLAPYFDRVVGAGDGPRAKPDMLLHALEHHGVDPADALYVGDTPGDLIAARAGGIRAVALTTGFFGADDLARFEPEIILDDLRDLPDRIG